MIYQDKLPKCLEQFDCKLYLKKNCRNTIKILQTVNSIFNANTDANSLSVSGIMPSLYFDENNSLNKLETIIDDFINDGFKENDITILTLSTEYDSMLNGLDKIGKYKFSNEEDNSIFFTTSKKFKGLESNIVIIIDFEANKYIDYEYKKNVYVSLSRARQRLSILCNRESDLKVLADTIEGNLDDTIKVARKFKIKIDK